MIEKIKLIRKVLSGKSIVIYRDEKNMLDVICGKEFSNKMVINSLASALKVFAGI